MKVSKLDDMVRGWFVGEFEPTAYSTPAAEIAVKHFAAGDREPRHVHRVATEITAVIQGRVLMEGVELGPGDIAVLEPGEPAEFEALTDVILVAAKVPGAKDDKFPA